MNSVIACTEFIIPMNFDLMTKGQACLVGSDGLFVGGPDEIKEGKMYQFVVALGDNKFKRGVWLNPKNANAYYEKYKAAEAKTFTFSDIKILVNNANVGEEIALVISLPPLTSFHSENVKQYTANTVLLKDDTDTDAKARLKASLDKVVEQINKDYGKDTIIISPEAGLPIMQELTVIGAVGLDFHCHFEGLVMATKNEDPKNITPVGTQKQIKDLEKNEDVANAGYNPNFDSAFDPYGDIFTATLAESYNVFTIDSRADRTHQFDINTLGMEVVQWVAIDTAGDADLLTEYVTALGGGVLNEY